MTQHRQKGRGIPPRPFMPIEEEAVKKVIYVETLAAMKAAVAERGEDYVYKRQPHPDGRLQSSTGVCLNTTPDGSAPGCIAGDVFHRLGVPLEWLANEDNINSSAIAVVQRLRHEESFDFDDKSPHLLAEAQSYQDSGTPWGQALKYAIQYVETGKHAD